MFFIFYDKELLREIDQIKIKKQVHVAETAENKFKNILMMQPIPGMRYFSVKFYLFRRKNVGKDFSSEIILN